MNEPETTHAAERVFDFGRILKRDECFIPCTQVLLNSFNGYVRKGEAVRYHLQIDAENYVATSKRIFEVAWDGEWADTQRKCNITLESLM